MKLTKSQYIQVIAEAVKTNGTCPQDKVGAVFATLDHEVLVTGYNGAPRGMKHCPEDCRGKCPNSVHAEVNAIIQAAKRGVELQGSDLYITRWPCKACAMMIVNLKVRSVVSWGKQNSEGLAVFEGSSVKFYHLDQHGYLGPIPPEE